MIDALFWTGVGVMIVALFGVLVTAYDNSVKPIALLIAFAGNLLVLFLCLYGALYF